MTIIRGQVVDAEGRPAAGASVYVVSAPVSMPDVAMLTGAGGEFDLAAPVPGRYTIGARSDEQGAGQTEIDVAGEAALTVRIQLNQTEGA